MSEEKLQNENISCKIGWIEAQSTLTLLIIIFLIQTALHAPYLNRPAAGFHQWRQTQTLSVARNFYDEGGSIFEPKVDSRGQYSGITGMEFPLVNYIIYLGYRVFGFSHIWERGSILLFSLLALYACFLFVRSLFDSKSMAFLSACFLIFSPLFMYYSITAMPDVPAIAFLFLSLALWQLQKERKSRLYIIFSLFFLLLAALIKIYCFMILIYYVYEIFKCYRTGKDRILFLTGLGIVIAISLAWVFYARHLSITHHNYDFRLSIPLPYDISVVPNRLKKVFLQWLPEFFVNYGEFILLVVGIVTLRKFKNENLKRFVLLYAIMELGFIFVMLHELDFHEYYVISALPLLMILVTAGFCYLFRKAPGRKGIQALIIFLIVMIPVLACLRTLPRFERATLDPELQTIESRLDKVIPDRSKLIIAGNDFSPSIYLYYMHRKGWSAKDTTPLEAIRNMVKNGAKYLVSDSRVLEQRAQEVIGMKLLTSQGKFNIFELTPLEEKDQNGSNPSS